EHLLEDLLGQAPVVQQPAGEGEGGTAVAAVGLGQGVLPPAADGHDQHGVAGLTQIVDRHMPLFRRRGPTRMPPSCPARPRPRPPGPTPPSTSRCCRRPPRWRRCSSTSTASLSATAPSAPTPRRPRPSAPWPTPPPATPWSSFSPTARPTTASTGWPSRR